MILWSRFVSWVGNLWEHTCSGDSRSGSPLQRADGQSPHFVSWVENLWEHTCSGDSRSGSPLQRAEERQLLSSVRDPHTYTIYVRSLQRVNIYFLTHVPWSARFALFKASLLLLLYSVRTLQVIHVHVCSSTCTCMYTTVHVHVLCSSHSHSHSHNAECIMCRFMSSITWTAL